MAMAIAVVAAASLTSTRVIVEDVTANPNWTSRFEELARER